MYMMYEQSSVTLLKFFHFLSLQPPTVLNQQFWVELSEAMGAGVNPYSRPICDLSTSEWKHLFV